MVDQSSYGLVQPNRNPAPLGLFGIAQPPHSMLPLLLHGVKCHSVIGDTIKYVLQAQLCSINDEDSRGSIALTHAVRFAPCNFSTAIMSSLIQRGARIGSKETSPEFITTLIAKRHGHITTITRLLLQSGLLQLNSRLLVAAVNSGNLSILKTVLTFEQDGKTLDVVDEFYFDDRDVEATVGVTALFFAVSGSKSSHIVQFLLEFGADIDAEWEGRTPLEIAISLPNCDPEVIDLLITFRASLRWGALSILHRAACTRSQVNGIHVVFHLLEHDDVRAMVNSLDQPLPGQPGVSPLYMACYTGNLGAVHALIDAGADVTMSATGLQSPLEIAIRVGRRPQLSLGWSGDLSDKKAIYEWRLHIEDMILALLNKRNTGHGMTQLHVAAQLGHHQRVVELVEDYGYSVFVEDRDKKLPSDFVEDIESVNDGGLYLDNLRELTEYLKLKLVEKYNSSTKNPEAMDQRIINNRSATGSKNGQWAMQGLQSRLSGLQINHNKEKYSAGEGLETPC